MARWLRSGLVRGVPTRLRPEQRTGPFAALVEGFDGLSFAGMLREFLDAVLCNGALRRRTKALVFAVVARALGCARCEAEAASVVVADGLPVEPPILPDRTGDRGKQPSLRFVSTSANGFSPLRELAGGQSFLVEATFPEPPKEDSFTVQLAADDGTQRSVTVFRSADDPKLFRSNVIALEAGR